MHIYKPGCFFLLACLFSLVSHAQKTLLFIGTYTGGQPDSGIYVYEFNTTSGALKKCSTVKNITNPSFLTVAPNGRFVYACTDTKMPGAGSVTAFKTDSVNGTLTLLNKQPAGGENPVYVSVYKNNRFVVNVNYTSGTASVFKVNNDGSLQPYAQVLHFFGSSINAARQDKAHLHAAVFSPAGDYLFLTDLGSDKLRVFKFDTMRAQPLIAMDSLNLSTVAGSGPRHFVFHPARPFAYCIEELSGTIAAYSCTNGKLIFNQRVFSYSKKEAAYESADIHISPDGLFLYASNRGEDNTLSVFSIDPHNGSLTLAGHQSTHGTHPRNFTIDPTGNFLLVANAFTNNIVVFKRSLKTGLLIKLNEITVPRPSCLHMRTYHTITGN